MASFTLRPISATGELPEGWLFRLPMGEQHVTAEMFRIVPGVRGAFRMVVSKRPPEGSWDDNALAALIDMVSCMVTEWDAFDEQRAEGIAVEFQTIRETGTVMEALRVIHGAFPTEIDSQGMRWVGVRRA